MSSLGVTMPDAGHAVPVCPLVAMCDPRRDALDQSSNRFPTAFFVAFHQQPPVPAVKMAQNPLRVRARLWRMSEQSSFLSLYRVRERCSRKSLQRNYRKPPWRLRGRSGPACRLQRNSMPLAITLAIQGDTGASYPPGMATAGRGRPRQPSISWSARRSITGDLTVKLRDRGIARQIVYPWLQNTLDGTVNAARPEPLSVDLHMGWGE